MFLFGDRGLPSSVRHVNGYSGNTYAFTKSDGSYRYVRIHFLTNQGVHWYTNAEGAKLAGTNPDKHLEDLQEAIRKGDFPSWNVHVQVIKPEDIPSDLDIFDMTKTWPHKEYPLRKIGKVTLDQNPKNWFAEIEQATFSPSNMVRGIAPAPDAMLQARMFAYPDASRYRVGVNYQMLPTNAPVSHVYCPIERDGFMNFVRLPGTFPFCTNNHPRPRITTTTPTMSAQRSSHSSSRRERTLLPSEQSKAKGPSTLPMRALRYHSHRK